MKSRSDLTDTERAHSVVKSMKTGTLSTIATEPSGYPFGSLMPYVVDERGCPVFIASRLAEHTANFSKDPRASLFVAASNGDSDPLALERVTLVGRVEASDAAEFREKYLEAHPEASLYLDMKDFAFYRLKVEAVRYVGGFGRMSWITKSNYAKRQD